MYDVTDDVTGYARAVGPALSTGNDVLDPVGRNEVARKPAELIVEHLENDLGSVAQNLVNFNHELTQQRRE